MQNQRRFPRLDMAVQIEYTILDKPLEVRNAQTQDISIAGVSIKTNELLEKGAYLDIKFYLPNDKNPIQAISKVVWSKEGSEKADSKSFEAGIEFVKIEYADQERISKFIIED